MNVPRPTQYLLPGLAEHARAARVRSGIVFLDLARDRYLSIYAPEQHNRSDTDTLSQALVEQLATQGLIARDGVPPASVETVMPYTIWRDLPAETIPTIRGGDILVFMMVLIRTTLAFHTHSFAALTASARLSPTTECTQVRYAELISRFERMCLWLPFRMQCLFRSFFLLRLLHAYGLSANWVFGVSLFPFHAHCWLAVGDQLVGERCDRTEGFVPILTIFNVVGKLS